MTNQAATYLAFNFTLVFLFASSNILNIDNISSDFILQRKAWINSYCIFFSTFSTSKSRSEISQYKKKQYFLFFKEKFINDIYLNFNHSSKNVRKPSHPQPLFSKTNRIPREKDCSFVSNPAIEGKWLNPINFAMDSLI